MRTLLLATTCLLALPAAANLVTFDDISDGLAGVVPNGYAGFDWQHAGYIRESTFPDSGYAAGVVSGQYAAYNTASILVFSAPQPFDFLGAYLTAAWEEDLWIDVWAEYQGNRVYEDYVVVGPSAPTWFDFNYYGVEAVLMLAYGGYDPDPGSGGSGDFFVMDNLSLNPAGRVADAGSTAVLLPVALLALAMAGRRHPAPAS